MKPSISLTDEQRAAVQAGAGLVRTISGAGTGKTTMLTHRIAWLADQGVPAQKILALSFTKAASREIGERACRLMKGGIMPTSSTIHSIAARILRGFPQFLDLDPNWTIIDDDMAKPLLRRIITEILPRAREAGFDVGDYEGNGAPPKPLVKTHLELLEPMIDGWKERAITAEMVRSRYGAGDPYGREMLACWVYEALQDALCTSNMYQISDLIPAATSLLTECDDVRNAVGSYFTHVMVDEFQDVNMAQVKFLRALSGNNNITVVGDDDQSIYLFRHAITDAMRLSPQLFPQAAAIGISDHVLTLNRRNTSEMLAKANMLVDHNPRHEPKDLRSQRSGEGVRVMTFKHDHQEAIAVVNRIRELIADGANPRDIAILSRSSSITLSLIARLSHQSVPHVVLNGVRFMERKQIRDIMAWMRLALNPACGLSFERATTAPTWGIGPAAIQTLRNCRESLGVDYIEAIRHCIREKLIRNTASADRMADVIETLSIMAQDSDIGPSEFIGNVLSETGYRKWIEEHADPVPPALANIQTFIRMALECEADGTTSLLKFMDDITLLEEVVEDDANAVTVGSIHKAKGREWDHVFVLGLDDDITPHAKSAENEYGMIESYDIWRDSDGCIEEERRILHVAMTRARVSIHLTSTTNRVPVRFPLKPSRFLDEMGISTRRESERDRGRPGETFGIATRRPRRGVVHDEYSQEIWPEP